MYTTCIYMCITCAYCHIAHAEGFSIKVFIYNHLLYLLLYIIILTLFGRICVLFQVTLPYKCAQGMTPRPGTPWFLHGPSSGMAGKAMGQWGKAAKALPETGWDQCPKTRRLCVRGWGWARPCFVGRQWPQNPQPGWAVNQSINQSITHWVVLSQPPIGRVIRQSHSGAVLVGQLSGRPTWGAGQWRLWRLKDGANVDIHFSWSFCFSHGGTLRVDSYMCILSVVGCCFDLHLLQTIFILWNTG